MLTGCQDTDTHPCTSSIQPLSTAVIKLAVADRQPARECWQESYQDTQAPMPIITSTAQHSSHKTGSYWQPASQPARECWRKVTRIHRHPCTPSIQPLSTTDVNPAVAARQQQGHTDGLWGHSHWWTVTSEVGHWLRQRSVTLMRRITYG